MKLRTKTVITVIILSLIFWTALNIVSLFVIQPSFKDLERQDAIREVNQAKGMLQDQADSLGAKVKDYAFWDDSYQFAQDGNQEFVNNNFADSTFDNLKLGLIAIIDNQGKILYCKVYNVSTSSQIEANSTLVQQLFSNISLSSVSTENNAISGIVNFDNEPVLFAKASILNTAMEGPSVGCMVFGKFLDNTLLSQLSRLEGFDIKVRSIAYFSQESKTLATGQTVLVENSANSLTGLTVINDAQSNPAFVLVTTSDRPVYQQGELVLNVFLFSSILISALFAIVMLLLLEREIVRPMTTLSRFIEEVSLNPNASVPSINHVADEVTIISKGLKNTIERKLEGMNEVSRMVAHDLRNPLAGIRNSVYIIRKRNLQKMDDESLALLEKVNECVTYSDKLVQNLLDFSSNINLDKVEVNAKQLVDGSLLKFALTPNVLFNNKVDDSITVKVDVERIERVFTNFIANSIDAMPVGGTITIESKKTRKAVRFDFVDTGLGMSKQTLGQLWNPFFTTKAKGMGIGLSICKRIIDAHNGKIQVHSIEGKGTRFSIYLPV